MIRYVDKDGNRVGKGAPGAKRVKTKTRTYYVSIPGEGLVSLKTSELGQAWINLRDELKRRADAEAGIRDTFTEQAGRAIGEHVGEWVAVLLAKGTSAEHVATMKARILAVVAEAGWKRVSEIDADQALKAVAKLQERDNLSAQTRNHYVAHLKQFTRWLARPSAARLRTDPLTELGKVNVEGDRRHRRRAPSLAELGTLFAHLSGPSAKIRKGMSGPQRALGYAVAMATGLRADELRSLLPDSFDLEAATVTVAAEYTKNGREVTLPLPSWLVTELRSWLDASGCLWNAFPAAWPGRLLKADLEASGVPYVVKGLFFDFHALRHGYISAIASQPGIDPKTLADLARHGDPKLSLETYAKAQQERRKAAAEAIPDPKKRVRPRLDDDSGNLYTGGG